MPESVQVPAGPREVLACFQQAAIERSVTSMVGLYAEDAIQEFPSPGRVCHHACRT